MLKLRSATSALFVVGTLTLLAPTSYAQNGKSQAAPVRIEITYIKPSAVIAYLRDKTGENKGLMPKGIDSLSPDDLNKNLLVTGSAESIARLQEIVRLLDIPTPTVHFLVRILRPTTSETNPVSPPAVVATASSEVQNNGTTPLTILISDISIDLSVTPHVNGDGTVLISSRASFTQTTQSKLGDSKRVSTGSATKVVQPGRGGILFGIVNTEIIPEKQVLPGTGQYLIEITPIVVPAPRVAEK